MSVITIYYTRAIQGFVLDTGGTRSVRFLTWQATVVLNTLSSEAVSMNTQLYSVWHLFRVKKSILATHSASLITNKVESKAGSALLVSGFCDIHGIWDPASERVWTNNKITLFVLRANLTSWFYFTFDVGSFKNTLMILLYCYLWVREF